MQLPYLKQVLDAMDPEDWKRLSVTRKKDGTVSGDLADRDQLKLLERYVFTILGRMVEELASGSVEANPYTRGNSHNACAYCPYEQVCNPKEVEGRRDYAAMKSEEFWERIERSVNADA